MIMNIDASAGSNLYLLHGVTDAHLAERVLERAREAGLDHIEAAAVGDLAGLVSMHGEALATSLSPEGMLASPERAADLAILHHTLLTAAVAVADVVPIRLGSVFSSVETARALLARERPRFAPELRRLKNTVEMGLRLFSPDVQATRIAEDAVGGRSYLRQRATLRHDAATLRADQSKAARTALERLAAHAVDAVKRPSRVREGEAALIADVAFLVKRDEIDAFKTAALAIQAELPASGIGVTCSGPWPAYSFVTNETGRGSSWATH